MSIPQSSSSSPLLPETIEDVDARSKANKLIAQIQEKQLPIIKERLNVEWNQALTNAPSYARESLRRAGYNDFLQEKYYEIIDEILQLEQKNVFIPTVAVEDLKTEEERARANRLCSSVQEEDVSLIDSTNLCGASCETHAGGNNQARAPFGQIMRSASPRMTTLGMVSGQSSGQP